MSHELKCKMKNYRGRVKMAVWEDAQLASPQSRAPAGCWWGTLTPKEMGRTQTEPVECRGLSGKEKWRPDRIGVPEAGDIRRGRWEGLSRKSRKGAESDHLAHSGGEPAGLLGEVPCPPKPPPGHVGPGGMGGPRPLKHRKPAGLPGEVPHPLRPGVGVSRLGPFCSLSLSPTPPQPPGPFPAL